MGSWGSPERSSGRGTPEQDSPCEVGPSGQRGPECPQRRSTGQREWSTPAPRNQDRRLPEVKDSGIDTGGTYGPGMTRVSWVPEDRQFLRSRGVDASTPMPGGKDSTHERRVGQCSPIMEGQPSRSSPHVVSVNPGGVELLPTVPGKVVRDSLVSPQVAKSTRTGRPGKLGI